MARRTDKNPERLRHRSWEKKRLLLLGQRYLHVTDEGHERWQDEPAPLCLQVAIVSDPERGKEYWIWTRTGTLAAEVMGRIQTHIGWCLRSHCAGSDLWTRPVADKAGAR